MRTNRRPVRTKKVSVPRKEWVVSVYYFFLFFFTTLKINKKYNFGHFLIQSTVNDLSVHKSTAEELVRRSLWYI